MKKQIANSLQKAVELIQKGHLVAIPTETVYGLSASIYNEEALKKIFHLKKRPFFDPLIIHISHVKQMEELATEWTPVHDILAKKFWPGPLTFILKKKDHVNSLITSGLPTVGVRMPNHPLTLNLINKVGPLAAPSANLFKKTSPTSPLHILKDFPKDELFILEGGNCTVGIESTILQIDYNQSSKKYDITILRPGIITKSDLQEELHNEAHEIFHFHDKNPTKVLAPGQMEDHYLPPNPLIILPDKNQLNDLEVVASINKVMKKYSYIFSKDNYQELELPKDPYVAARKLYELLRISSIENSGFILLIKKPYMTGDVWHSVWDRLLKASSYHLLQ